MEEIDGKRLPWVGLSLNELSYLVRCDDLMSSGRYTDVPDVKPERAQIVEIGKMYPRVFVWKNNVGTALRCMNFSGKMNPLMGGVTEDYQLKFFGKGELSEDDIDLAVKKSLLLPEYAGPLKVYERVAELVDGIGEEKKGEHGGIINSARDRGLISSFCANELLENGIRAIRKLPNPTYVSKHSDKPSSY
jgi:hypothetical protein